MYTYKSKLVRVIDGDTIDAEIDLGFGIFIKQRIKLYGISTPDSKSKDTNIKHKGVDAKAHLVKILPKEFMVETILNKRGKFGRVLGVVFFIDDNDTKHTLNDILVQDGYAEVYLPGTKD
ncbi:thermonuclease family protein [bacterium]|nr:thermonuclease family protein [bacterium]MDB4128506.1 thermonuclease family protein [bacterium]MDC1257293.1 thermonuclease family protein [bacterium]